MTDSWYLVLTIPYFTKRSSFYSKSISGLILIEYLLYLVIHLIDEHH
nr:MAG TPA: hypothetical protein [Caudoviricetes sp.]